MMRLRKWQFFSPAPLSDTMCTDRMSPQERDPPCTRVSSDFPVKTKLTMGIPPSLRGTLERCEGGVNNAFRLQSQDGGMGGTYVTSPPKFLTNAVDSTMQPQKNMVVGTARDAYQCRVCRVGFGQRQDVLHFEGDMTFSIMFLSRYVVKI